MYRKRILTIAIFSLSVVFVCAWRLSGINQESGVVFAGDILESGERLYSQYNEELIIRDFFNDRRGGVFLDVGSAHYRNMSTTYYLENHLGWSGIAVDALAEFTLGYIENRPNTRFFSFIVTDHSWSIEPFYRLINATGLSSKSTKRIDWAAEYFNVEGKTQIVYMPTITLTDLLEKNGILKIDFLSLDIEGGEEEALAGFDIERFRPELVCIEKNSGKREEIRDYFSRHHYELIEEYLKHDKVNWYFKPKE